MTPKKTFHAFSNNYIEYESKGVKDKTLSIKEYFDMNRSYLSDVVNDHKTQGEWKLQLTMSISFISSEDSDETRTTDKKSDDIKIIIGKETDGIIRNLFSSILQKCKNDSEKK